MLQSETVLFFVCVGEFDNQRFYYFVNYYRYAIQRGQSHFEVILQYLYYGHAAFADKMLLKSTDSK